MATLWTDTYYRMSHITGPRCVLVSLRFGKTPENGPLVTFRSKPEEIFKPSFDLIAYTQEAIEGVREANSQYQGNLELEEIEIVPDDHPGEGQVRHCAFKIAEMELKKT